MADVFISYSRSDRDRCTAICAALEALKVSVWFDAGIGAGSSFDREIEREIEAAKALLVLWSAASVESDWVRNEARTGKERAGLIAVQLESCQLPLEFRSIQAEILRDGAEGTDDPVWLGILSRIGEIVGRPGLAEYARLSKGGTIEEWKRWLGRYASDPLASAVIDNIVEHAMPDMRQQVATERARRTALEAELAAQVDSSKAQSDETASSARELVRLRRELADAEIAGRVAQNELEQYRSASGTIGGQGDTGLASLGIVLDQRLAIYLCGLLWLVAILFVSPPIGNLADGGAGVPDILRIVIGLIGLAGPAIILTVKILRRRSALAKQAAAD